MLFTDLKNNTMSRIDVLKKQNPSLNFNFVEMVANIIKKPKYVELFVNLLKKRPEKTYRQKKDYIDVLENSWGVKFTNYETVSGLEVVILLRVLEEILQREDVVSFFKFIEFNERFLIKQSDLSTYNTFEEIRAQVSLTELAMVDKELEKHVIKLYEDDKNLLIKPLSWDASKKYGSNTKWCTTTTDDPNHFYRYAVQGMLIYYINKETGSKTAIFKSVSEYDKELSFWDSSDSRIDSMMADIPFEMLGRIKNEVSGQTLKSNVDLLTPEQRKEQVDYLVKNKFECDWLTEIGITHSGRRHRILRAAENAENILIEVDAPDTAPNAA